MRISGSSTGALQPSSTGGLRRRRSETAGSSKMASKKRVATAFPAVLLVAVFLASAPQNSAEATHNPTHAPVFPLLATHIHDFVPSFAADGSGQGGEIDHSSPIIVDLDGVGPKPPAAIVAARNGCIYAYTYNAAGSNVYSRFNFLPGFPACIPAIINSSPAIADLNGDGVQEIIVGAGKLYQPGEYGSGQAQFGGIWVINASGGNYWGGYVQVVEGVFSTPAVGDIDADGSPDIVFGDFAMNVRAINAGGGNKWSVHIADTVWSSPALTPLPGTNKLATVIGTDLGGGNPGGHLGCPQYYTQPGDGTYLVRGFLLALNEVGGVISGFPKCLDTPIWSSPALTDLNNDGRIDAVFATNNYFENGNVVGRSARVYAIDLWWPGQHMQYLPGWPVSHGGSEAKSMSSPAIGDLNNDGLKEVAVGNNYTCTAQRWTCGRVSLFGAFGGPPIWERVGEFEDRVFNSSPVMADVAGDGKPEVVIGGGDWRVHAFDFGGNYVGNFYTGCTAQQPSFCNAGRQFRNAPAVGDLTGDGKNDIFVGGGTHDSVPRPQVWLLGTLNANPAAPAPWPYFKRDQYRQSNDFNPPGLLPGVTNLVAKGGNNKVKLTWTNPTSPSVTGVRLVRKVGTCPTSASDGVVVMDSLVNTYTDNTAVNGTTYCYGAYAHDASNNFANGAFATATPAPPPGPPTSVTTRADDTQISIFWTNPTGNNFEAVRVVRKAGTTPPANVGDGLTVYDGPGTTYTDVGLDNGQNYSYGLFSRNGIPEFSSPATATDLPNPHSGPAFAVYLAEGYTGGPGFESVEYLTIANTDPSVASSVTLSYMFETGPGPQKNYVVPASRRITVNAASDVGGGKAVGVRVSTRSGPAVVVERPMYFNGNPGVAHLNGGHAAVSVPKPLNEWYLAEGYTGPGFVEYLTILNPAGSGSTNARATFVFNGGGTPQNHDFVVKPQSRLTLNVNSIVGPNREVSVKVAVLGGPPIVVERVMYFSATAGLPVNVDGGHVHAGAEAPAMEWLFAEGYTGPGFIEYLTLQNPNPGPSNITATYVFNGGIPAMTKKYTLPGNSRTTLNVNGEVGPNREVSVKISVDPGSPPIVAERPMYFHADPALGATADGGHDVVGATSAGPVWFFAEGYTGGGFVEFLTIQNPSLTEQIGLEFRYVFNSADPPVVLNRVIPPASRVTVTVNNDVGPGREVSTRVTRTSGPNPVVERPMYFNASAGLSTAVNGGHDVVGYQPPP